VQPCARLEQAGELAGIVRPRQRDERSLPQGFGFQSFALVKRGEDLKAQRPRERTAVLGGREAREVGERLRPGCHRRFARRRPRLAEPQLIEQRVDGSAQGDRSRQAIVERQPFQRTRRRLVPRPTRRCPLPQHSAQLEACAGAFDVAYDDPGRAELACEPKRIIELQRAAASAEGARKQRRVRHAQAGSLLGALREVAGHQRARDAIEARLGCLNRQHDELIAAGREHVAEERALALEPARALRRLGLRPRHADFAVSVPERAAERGEEHGDTKAAPARTPPARRR
jgi:hypothetical protein